MVMGHLPVSPKKALVSQAAVVFGSHGQMSYMD